MGNIFLKTLNMSIAASWLILAVVLLRFMLRKAPKWIAVLLWGIVALRLVVPFSFESVLSLIPSAETFNAHNIQYETPAISSGISAVNNAVNPVLGETFAPNPVGSVNPLYVWTLVASAIWLVGIAAILLYAVISYVRVRRSVAERMPYEANIFLCDHVKSPFILGLIRPKIYLPSNMDATSMEPMVAHEKAHLARRDHWWKPLGFLILAVHWFNPLCWVAYVLLCRDIELACDEKVIRQMDLDEKKQYSTVLLECSTQRRLVTICPLAFGEVGVKERVKNVLNYKKPAFWIIVVAVAACAVVTVCFATNPVTAEPNTPNTERPTFQEDPSGNLILEEYWNPRDGSYYAQDIREKFPAHIVEDGMDSQKFILPQQQECYEQAVASAGLDTDKVIGALLETICSSPALSSNPGDYIEEHPIEYRELTYYGRYTLKYCFARFEEGNETGLEGHIMRTVCEDIAVGWGEAFPTDYVVITGQMWYDAFKSNALGLMEQYREIELAERYPASYLLLSMLGEVSIT